MKIVFKIVCRFFVAGRRFGDFKMILQLLKMMKLSLLVVVGWSWSCWLGAAWYCLDSAFIYNWKKYFFNFCFFCSFNLPFCSSFVFYCSLSSCIFVISIILRVFSLFWTDWSLSFLAHSLSYVTITFLSIMFTETSDSRTTSSSYRLRHRRGLISVSEPFVIRNKSDSSFFCIIWSQRDFFQLMSLILS